jgi:ribonuclease P protein component
LPGAAPRDASVSRSKDRVTDRTLKRACRLRARTQFLDVYDRGQRVHSAYFVVFAVVGGTVETRLGITATKKFGHAVARNRVKRLVREIFRTNRGVVSDALDLVVNVKSTARLQSYDRLEADLVPRLRELSRRVHV